jgi:hypothetical protein
MNVKELKDLLNKYPDDMVILNTRYSDYQIVSESDWTVIKGVDNNGWVMRSHPTMSDENKLKERSYLHLAGN